jgi:hypothetical protein
VQVLKIYYTKSRDQIPCETIFIDRQNSLNPKEWHFYLLVEDYELKKMTVSKLMTVPFTPPISKKVIYFNFDARRNYDVGPTLGELSDDDIRNIIKRVEEDDHVAWVQSYGAEKKKQYEKQLLKLKKKEDEVREILKARNLDVDNILDEVDDAAVPEAEEADGEETTDETDD